MAWTSLGQQAYQAYGASRGWLAHDGKEMPIWSAVKPEIQAGWQAAAEMVANSVLDVVKEELPPKDFRVLRHVFFPRELV